MPKLWVELCRQKPIGTWDDRESERPLRVGWTTDSKSISPKDAIDAMRRAFDGKQEIVLVESCDLATEILREFCARAEVSAQKASVSAPLPGDRVMECMIDCWMLVMTCGGEKAVAILDWRITTIVDEAAIAAAIIEENGGQGYYPDDERDQT